MEIKHLADVPTAIPTLAAWVYGEWGRWMEPDVNPETLMGTFEKRTTPHQIPETFVALNQGVPIGTASLVAHDMQERQDLTPWLSAVYVPMELRHRKIGSALVRTVMEEAQYLGVETLYLFTPDMMPFYRSLGWEELEVAEHKGRPVTIMTINLSP